MCKSILQLSIRVMCDSAAITCTCVSHTHAHVLWVQASKTMRMCVCADINHFSTAAVCRSIYPQISRLKSPSNHHVVSRRSEPGRLSNLSRLCVSVCMRQHVFAPVFKRMCECRECFRANVGWRERVSVSERVIMCDYERN